MRRARILAAPHLIELANDPRLLRIAESYLGCPPTLYSVNAWWSFAQGSPASMSQAWYRDRDDFRFVTLFMYLTPVTSLNGPHRYARFSHDQPALTEQLIRLGMPAAEAQAANDPQLWGTGYQHSEQTEATLSDFVHTWLGAAGTAILADTYGLHMGKPPQQGEHLMFWARYGLDANAGSVTRDEMAGGVDLAARLGRAPRTRYVNRLLTADETILDEIAPDPEPADPLSL